MSGDAGNDWVKEPIEMWERRFQFLSGSKSEKKLIVDSLRRIGFVADGDSGWTRTGVLLRETVEGDDEIVYRYAPRRLPVGLCITAIVTSVVLLSVLSFRWLAHASWGTPTTDIFGGLSIVFWSWLGMLVYAWMVEGGFRRERQFLDSIMESRHPSDAPSDG